MRLLVGAAFTVAVGALAVLGTVGAWTAPVVAVGIFGACVAVGWLVGDGERA